MKSFTALVLAVLALVAVASASTVQSTPAYMWGSEGYFNGAKIISTASVNTRSLREIFGSVVFGVKSSLYDRTATAVEAPKAVFTVSQKDFTTPHANQLMGVYGGEAALKNIANAISQQSLTVSHIFADGFNARSMVPTSAPTTRAFTAQSTCDELVSYINTAVAAAGGRIANINVVSSDLSTLSVIDQCLPVVSQALAEATNNRYIAALVGTASGASPVHQSFLEMDSYIFNTASTFAPQGTTNSTEFEGPKYITSQTVTALTISFILLIAAWIGFQCTMSIETPIRYAQPHQVLLPTKDY